MVNISHSQGYESHVKPKPDGIYYLCPSMDKGVAKIRKGLGIQRKYGWFARKGICSRSVETVTLIQLTSQRKGVNKDGQAVRQTKTLIDG